MPLDFGTSKEGEPLDPSRSSLAHREAAARRELREALAAYENVTAREHNLFIRCANAIAGKELPPPASVMLLATARILGDLRVCTWAATTGYAIQASAIAATVHELSYSAAFIGESEERAKEWLDHQNERKQYPESGYRAILEDVMPRLAAGKSEAEREYSIYTQLCMAKHGNPMLQRHHGTSEEDDARIIEQQPYIDENTVPLARFALFHASRAVLALLTALLTTHLLTGLNADGVEEFKAINKELMRLGERDGLIQ